MTYQIFLSATNKAVSLPAYCAAIRKAKANPDSIFKHSLNRWSPSTGKEIMREYRQAMHHRINCNGHESWRNVETLEEIEMRRDKQALHDWLQKRIICRKLTSPKLQKRFKHLLFVDDEY